MFWEILIFLVPASKSNLDIKPQSKMQRPSTNFKLEVILTPAWTQKCSYLLKTLTLILIFMMKFSRDYFHHLVMILIGRHDKGYSNHIADKKRICICRVVLFKSLFSYYKIWNDTRIKRETVTYHLLLVQDMIEHYPYPPSCNSLRNLKSRNRLMGKNRLL